MRLCPPFYMVFCQVVPVHIPGFDSLVEIQVFPTANRLRQGGTPRMTPCAHFTGRCSCLPPCLSYGPHLIIPRRSYPVFSQRSWRAALQVQTAATDGRFPGETSRGNGRALMIGLDSCGLPRLPSPLSVLGRLPSRRFFISCGFVAICSSSAQVSNFMILLRSMIMSFTFGQVPGSSLSLDVVGCGTLTAYYHTNTNGTVAE